MNTALRLDGLAVRLPEGRVLGPLTGSLGAGEKAVLVGASGSGKSTLMRAVAALRPATEGTITVQDTPVTPGSVSAIRRCIAFVPQEPTLGPGTVREVLERPFAYRANHGVTYDATRAAELLATFRLGDAVLDQPTAQLSGGEKQRVALVAALLLNRPIYVLDEIISALGHDDAINVARHLRGLDGVTVLVSSHTPEVFDGWRRVELPHGARA